MKNKILSFAIVLCMLFGIMVVPVGAEQQKCGENAVWDFQDGVLTIEGTGELYDYSHPNWSNYPWYQLRNDIQTVVICKGIENVPTDAFTEEYDSLTTVYIASTVSAIGEYAFYNDNALQDMYFYGNAPAVGGKSISYNENLVLHYISGTSGWTDSTAYDNVENKWCGHSLESWLDGNERVEEGSKGDTYVLDGNGVLTIYSASGYFKGVSENFNTYIWDEFYKDVKKIVLSETVKYIDSQAFDSCELDVVLSLPKTLEWIDGYAFARCPSISLELDSENPNFTLVDGILYSKDMTKLVYASPKLTGNFVTPESVTTVCDGAFVFSQFDSITISDNVTTMMTSAYREGTLWDGGEYCGRVFANALCKHITIGKNVEELGRCLVFRCPYLEDITVLGMKTAFEDDFVIDDTGNPAVILGEPVQCNVAKLCFYPGSLAEEYAIQYYHGARAYLSAPSSTTGGGGAVEPVEPEKIQQNISVDALTEKTYGVDEWFLLRATYDTQSGLAAFTFESSNPEVAEIGGGPTVSDCTVIIKSAGETQITVKQAGNDEYAPYEYTQTLVVRPKEIEITSIDVDAKTAQINGVLEEDKDDVELDFDKLDKTFNEIKEIEMLNEFEEIETVKKAKMTVRNFVLKGDKAKNYTVTTDSKTAYAKVDEVNVENIDTTEGVTADVLKTDDTAIISNVDISAMDEDDKNIVFDLTGDLNISAISIAATALQAAVSAEKGYQFKTTDKNNKAASITFDKAALETIAEDVTGNISIKISNPENSDLNEDQQTTKAELDAKNPAVYSFNIENGNTDFGTGKAMVGVYYDKTQAGNVKALCLKEDGTTEDVTVTYNDTEKTATLALSHFSDYVIYTEPAPVHHSSGGGGGVSSYTVKLDTNGGEELKNISIKKGQAIGTIPTPAKKGYVFDGWYSDKELTKAYSGEEKVTEATTLYAGWKVDPVRQLTLTIGDKNATVFGEETANDVAPIIRNDRTMLPIRFIAEALGAEVIWDSATKVVTITNDDIEIKITIDQGVAIVNGEEITLDSPAFIESDRTFLPLRFVSENLGAEVDWVEETKQVVITKPIEE